ncbi:MAG TPA: CPBP family intramembrane glutamic endopeptidase [Steroidobacteraceae bacterium]|nr:CPBP family intramembrane glutamic endopeptidase [Steroidobacteraceae bacterium]
MQVTAFYLLSLVFACLAMLLWQLPEGFRIGDVTAVREAYHRVGLVFGFTPALAALIIAFAYDRGRGVKELLGRLFVLRFPAVWWLVALAVPLLPQWLGVYLWSAAFDEPLRFPSFTQWLGSFLSLALINGLFSLGEELGWRGFMLPRMLARHGWVNAALITGVLWSIWHFPLWGLANYALSGSVVHTMLELLLTTLTATSVSVIITAIFLHTRQSLIPSLLLHGASNANMNLIYAGTSERALTSIQLLAIQTALFTLAALLFVLVFWHVDSGRVKP